MRRPLLSHGTKPDGKRANRLTMKLLPPGFVIFSTRAAKHDLGLLQSETRSFACFTPTAFDVIHKNIIFAGGTIN